MNYSGPILSVPVRRPKKGSGVNKVYFPVAVQRGMSYKIEKFSAKAKSQRGLKGNVRAFRVYANGDGTAIPEEWIAAKGVEVTVVATQGDAPKYTYSYKPLG